MVKLNLNIPKDFYLKEEKNGFLVTEQMKKVWAVELDLLNELLRVCDKYNIKIMANGGTILGAARHKGFIPWDDDIDMMMTRQEYNKLCKIAPSEFKEPYFFQTEYTDPGSMRGHAQLRNSQTTAILESESRTKKHFNQGIFIDIFPLDKVTTDNNKLEKQLKLIERHKNNAKRFYRNTDGYSSMEKTLKRRLLHVFFKVVSVFCSYQKIYRKFEDDCMKYDNENAEYYAIFSINGGNPKHFKLIEYCSEIQEMPFEFLSIPVPKEYEKILSHDYGDWKKYVVGGSLHGGVIFDTEKSYKEYI